MKPGRLTMIAVFTFATCGLFPACTQPSPRSGIRTGYALPMAVRLEAIQHSAARPRPTTT